MDTLARRLDFSCEGSKQWYVCSAGNFRGCCASDPCTSGFCFDDNVSLLHLTSAASYTSSTTSKSSTSTSTIANASSAMPSTNVLNTSSSTKTSVSSEASSTANVADSTESSSSTTSTTATSGEAAASTGTPSSSKRPIIGGVVGGIAALVLFILLLWLCSRRSKRHGKSYSIYLRRSPSTKSLHDREMASVSKTELALSEKNSTKQPHEPHHGSETASPPTNSTTHSILSTPGSTTAFSLTAPTVSHDPSEYSTLSSAILSTSGRFVRLAPIRMPTLQPTTGIPAGIPQSESQSAAELSDTGFYRQRAELAAHSQSELMNVPLERRRRKGPLNPGPSPSSSSGSSSGSSESCPRSAIDKRGDSPFMNRHTAQRVVTRDGIVMGANLDRYSTALQRGGDIGGKKSDSGQEHVMSFMTFGGSEVEMVQRRWSSSPGQGNSGSVGSNEREAGSASSNMRLGGGVVLEDFGASPIGEAPPVYDAGGVASPKHDDKSPSGTTELGIHRRG